MPTMLERLGLRRRTTASPPPIGVVGAVPPRPVAKTSPYGVGPLQQTPKRKQRSLRDLLLGGDEESIQKLRRRIEDKIIDG